MKSVIFVRFHSDDALFLCGGDDGVDGNWFQLLVPFVSIWDTLDLAELVPAVCNEHIDALISSFNTGPAATNERLSELYPLVVRGILLVVSSFSLEMNRFNGHSSGWLNSLTHFISNSGLNESMRNLMATNRRNHITIVGSATLAPVEQRSLTPRVLDGRDEQDEIEEQE